MAWSARPGCFERHLQIRYNNPIFPERFRSVTEQELAEAQAKDSENAHKFQAQFVALLKDVSASEDVVPYKDISPLRQRIDELLDKASELGESVTEATTKLKELRELMTDTSYETFAGGNLKEVYDALQDAEQFNRSGREVFRNPFIAQLRHIPAEELVPRLLSEDAETIRTAMRALDEKGIHAFQLSSIQRVEEIIQEMNGYDNPLFDELCLKLEAMGVNFKKSPKNT